MGIKIPYSKQGQMMSVDVIQHTLVTTYQHSLKDLVPRSKIINSNAACVVQNLLSTQCYYEFVSHRVECHIYLTSADYVECHIQPMSCFTK